VTTSLDGARVRHPKAQWERCTGVYEAIVERRTFEAAQEIIRTREVHMNSAEMLSALAHILKERGKLSEAIIVETPGVPCATAYHSRFGSLRAAYVAVGYQCRKPGMTCTNLSDEDLLLRLAWLMEEHGYLSAALVDRTEGLPSRTTYARRFGTILKAFARVGYVCMTPAERASPLGRARATAALAAPRPYLP
jgi:hypothetical protein